MDGKIQNLEGIYVGLIRMIEMLDTFDNLAFNNMEERLSKFPRDKVMVTKEAKLHITHFQIANEQHSFRVDIKID